MLNRILQVLHLRGKPLALAGPICAKFHDLIEDVGSMIEFKGEDWHFACFLEIPTVERRIGERRAG